MARTDELLHALLTPDGDRRAEAARSLRDMGPRAVEILLTGSTSTDPAIRAASVAMMDHLGDERCLRALERALADRSAEVRRHAVHAIGCQACKAAPLALDAVALLVERALADPSIRVRRVATHMLGLQSPDPRAVAALRRIAREHDAQLVRRARLALIAQVSARRPTVLGAPPSPRASSANRT